MKEINYGRLFLVGFVLIAILFALQVTIVTRVSLEVDNKIEKIKLEAQETIEGIKCEFNYKNEIYYKGICTDELLEDTADLIGFDYRTDLLQLCMQNPYAYRYELCREMEAKK